MALVHNNNLSTFAGVSKQALELRLPSYCEEMVNCYPSILYGVQRRNPTMSLSTDIIVENDQFLHSYDRGLSGESSEAYLITIDKLNGLRVFDINVGIYRTVTYIGNSASYLESSNPTIGFSALTIKDTTFIVNRDTIPKMLANSQTTSTVNYALLSVDMSGYSLTIVSKSTATIYKTKLVSELAPARIALYTGVTGLYPVIASIGAITTIVVDGISVVYTTTVRSDGYSIIPESLAEYRMNITNLLHEQLGTNYAVSIDTLGKIYVYDLTGTAITVTATITYPTAIKVKPPYLQKKPALTLVSELNYGNTPIVITTGTSSQYTSYVSDYDKKGFIWIKQVSVDPTFPYTFTLTLKEINGSTIGSTTSAVTTSNGVATALATWANGLVDFTASSEGSVLKITRDSGIAFELVVSDTYGSQASSAFRGVVSQLDDLPKHFPYKDTIIKVDGIKKNDDVAYWVRYDGNSWVEWRDPNIANVINNTTMPHKLIRNADFTFTLSPIEWANMLVGDKDSQTIPEFIGSQIKDLFFINGRLGLLTKNGISLSQQNELYNFFRTTVLQLLDDSAISTFVDSNISIGLEYAVELQNSVILFGDKVQFKLDASKAITPATISVAHIAGFEINKNVKPIAVGDSVFFLVSRSGYSSLMEMNQTTVSMNIDAIDVSAHVPNYIDSDIMQITASQRDNCIFLRSRTEKSTVYVYKHYGTEQDPAQQAWSKWVFGMDIRSIFAFNKELYLFGSRYDATIPLNEYPLVEIWRDDRFWNDEAYWSDTTLASTPSFEKIDIDSYNVESTFKDNGTIRYDSEIELSKWALIDKNSLKELRGTLLVKTARIVAADNSVFSLVVEDTERNTTRTIPSAYTVNRNPFIGGNSDNTKLKILSTNGDGFQITAISLEGQYNVRSKRV